MKPCLRFVGSALLYLTFLGDRGQCKRAFSATGPSKQKASQHHPMTTIHCKDPATEDQASRSGHVVVEGEVRCPTSATATLLQGQRLLWIYDEETDCGGLARIRPTGGRFRIVLPRNTLPFMLVNVKVCKANEKGEIEYACELVNITADNIPVELERSFVAGEETLNRDGNGRSACAVQLWVTMGTDYGSDFQVESRPGNQGLSETSTTRATFKDFNDEIEDTIGGRKRAWGEETEFPLRIPWSTNEDLERVRRWENLHRPMSRKKSKERKRLLDRGVSPKTNLNKMAKSVEIGLTKVTPLKVLEKQGNDYDLAIQKRIKPTSIHNYRCKKLASWCVILKNKNESRISLINKKRVDKSGLSWMKRDDNKRKWDDSGMSWMKRDDNKRKWDDSGMSWIKRDEDKRKWDDSGMSWIKRDET